MPRAKRAVIDDAAELGFGNYGTDWWDRGVAQTFTEEPVAPQDDWITLSVPAIFLGDGSSVDTVTLWGRGLLTFGSPTAAQTAYMAMLSDDDDLSAFLAGFPGAYIDVGFQHTSYGSVEFGRGARDFVADPFGSFRDPFDPDPTGAPIHDYTQVRAYAYVAWGDVPFEGTAEDWEYLENAPIGPGARFGVEFSDEGFRVGMAGGMLRLGDAVISVGGNGFVYYSDLNRVDLTGNDDAVMVAGGPEALYGLGGDDHLTGGAHADALHGGEGADVLSGGGGIDRLFGGEGDDDLSDGDEQGLLSGGAGNDILRPGRGEDTIDGGDGVDRIVVDYTGWNAAIVFALDPAQVDYRFPDAYKRMTGVEAMTFTSGAGRDALTGANASDVLAGGDGQDRLIGNDGADTLLGGRHRDHLEGGAGDDWLDGGTGEGPQVIVDSSYRTYDLDADPDLLVLATQQNQGGSFGWQSEFTFTATGEEASLFIDLSPISGDQVYAYYGLWIDRVLADGTRVTLVDQAHEGAGLYALYGLEPLYEDAGSYPPVGAGDRFILTIYSIDDDAADISVAVRHWQAPIPDRDTMVGGSGNDTFVVDSLYDTVVEHEGEGHDTVLTALATYTLADLPNVERLTGSADAQTLTGNGLDNTIISGGGADTIDGGAGDDWLVLGGTPARVDGGSGEDCLVVDRDAVVVLTSEQLSGIESLRVRDGGTLDLSAFDDLIGPLRSMSTASGAARITGTSSGDTIRGGAGADALAGNGGDDLIILAHQSGAIDGGEGIDRLMLRGELGTVFAFTGQQLTDVEVVRVVGGTTLDLTGLTAAPVRIRLLGSSVVTGSDGNDRITGSAQADVIAGGRGGDMMTGGDGADRFVFAAGDATHGAARDRITDFSAGEGDQIDVSALSQEGFAFLGSAAFSGAVGTAAEVRATVARSGATFVQIDLDHDAMADVSFLVRADAPITAADFHF